MDRSHRDQIRCPGWWVVAESEYILTLTDLRYSFVGSVFELEFAFQHGIIDVYKIYDGGHNRVTSYEPQIPLSEIKGLQVWGDVKKVKEVTFCYA